jgi:hypothetical protein
MRIFNSSYLAASARKIALLDLGIKVTSKAALCFRTQLLQIYEWLALIRMA